MELGNSIDRVWRGEVVDFLDCYVKDYHWPAFNIADCAICVGIGIYMLSVILRPETAKAVEKSENAN
jgi:signal peptidase II